jgi:hypothetical protein
MVAADVPHDVVSHLAFDRVELAAADGAQNRLRAFGVRMPIHCFLLSMVVS